MLNSLNLPWTKTKTKQKYPTKLPFLFFVHDNYFGFTSLFFLLWTLLLPSNTNDSCLAWSWSQVAKCVEFVRSVQCAVATWITFTKTHGSGSSPDLGKHWKTLAQAIIRVFNLIRRYQQHLFHFMWQLTNQMAELYFAGRTIDLIHFSQIWLLPIDCCYHEF